MEVLSLVTICYNLLCNAFISQEYKTNGMIRNTQTLWKYGIVFQEIFRKIASININILYQIMDNIDGDVLSIAYAYDNIALSKILQVKNKSKKLLLQDGIYKSQLPIPENTKNQKTAYEKLCDARDTTSYLMYEKDYTYNGYLLAYCSINDDVRLIKFINENIYQYDMLVYYDDEFGKGYLVNEEIAEKFSAHEKISVYLAKNPINLVDPKEILEVKLTKPIIQQKNVVYCEVDEARAKEIEKIRDQEKEKQEKRKKQKADELRKMKAQQFKVQKSKAQKSGKQKQKA